MADAPNDLRLTELIGSLRELHVDGTEGHRIETLLEEIAAADEPYVRHLQLNADFERLLSNAAAQTLSTRLSVAKCIAEITKVDEQRQRLTHPTIIRLLVDALQMDTVLPSDDPTKTTKSIAHTTSPQTMNCLIQVCRALGNILYQNQDARRFISADGSEKALVRLLDVRADSLTCSVAEFGQFVTVRCGLISNYLVGGEEEAKLAMEHGIMLKIERLLVDASNSETAANAVRANEELIVNVLPPLTIVTENVPDVVFGAELNRRLVSILGASTNADIAEMCLDLLHYQAENDDVKLLLAKEGLCETIYQLLEKYKVQATTSEARALMKLACEIVVLILTGDDSMHFLYDTPLVRHIEYWLDASDVDLLTTGVLALGNFARTDTHCIHLVERGIMRKLLVILARNNGIDDDMRLQHALLSTLRNLVIPRPNKQAVIDAGLVETILPMLHIHQPPVVFKLLGTLRMTVDGQERLALELLQNSALLAQLVYWSRASEFASVTGESQRLMAWMIKHAYVKRRHAVDVAAGAAATTGAPSAVDISGLRSFVRTTDAVECMVNMLTSQHLVMQNEALIALSILSSLLGSAKTSTTNDDDIDLDMVLVKNELGARLAEFITKSADTMTKEIVENLQTYVGLLRQSTVPLVAHLGSHNIDELLKTIPILTEYCTL